MENKLAFIRTSVEKLVQSPAVPVKGVEGGSPFSVGRISAGGCAMDFPIDGISQANVGVDGAENAADKEASSVAMPRPQQSPYDGDLLGWPVGMSDGTGSEQSGLHDDRFDEDYWEPVGRPRTLADQFENMSTDRMNRLFFHNSMMGIGAGLPKLPWEEGVFAQIFGTADPFGLPVESDYTPMPAFPVFKTPTTMDQASETSAAAASYGIPKFAKHVKALCDTDYKQALDLKWARALACWLTILESSRFESNVGKYAVAKLSDWG